MVEIIKYPKQEEWPEHSRRAAVADTDARAAVAEIIAAVERRGDEALKDLTLKFDGYRPASLKTEQEEIDKACMEISGDLQQAIKTAAANIGKFHAAQMPQAIDVEVMPGINCSQRAVPITRVGLYIPGGNSPLFSTVLMLAIPARLAGCREVVLCTPPDKQGKVHPAILYAARLAGVSRVYKAGGVQAIGAMAYGTETVPRVYKIFGPGNQYVMAAKQQVSLHDVAIDMPAGPSEVAVLADEWADPAFVAADLLSQAEHGADSQVLLVTTSATLVERVQAEVERQLALLPRRELAASSLSHSKLILLHTMDEAVDLVNDYAPEHLIIETRDYATLADRVVNAGSVFLGAYTPESAGDYASGTNHTLPTSGYARAYSGVNLDSFVRKITFQEIAPEGIRHIGPAIEQLASGERLDAHRNAVTLRLNSLKQDRQ